MERLKGGAVPADALTGVYLHSSMERLKAGIRKRLRDGKLEFTFQYGEIKRPTKSDALYTQMVFTFQYGEIKSVIMTGRPK